MFKFPTFVEDGAKAVALDVPTHCRSGQSRIGSFVAGHSAGAHIGALVTADKHYLQAEGETPSIIKAFAWFILVPIRFCPSEEDYIAMFGPPENYPTCKYDLY